MNSIRPNKMIVMFFAMLVLIQGWPFLAKAAGVSYDVIYGYQGNMAIFEKDGKQGAMNLKQMVIIPPIYDYISLFEHGLARVLVDKKWGMVRDTGGIIIKPQYDYISSFIPEASCPADSKPMACIVLNQKMGFVDSSGKVICEPRFEENRDAWAEHYTRDGIYVEENGLWGILGTDGHMVAEPQYSYPEPWDRHHEYMFITDTTVTKGLTLEQTLTESMNIDHQSLEDFIALLSLVHKNTKWYRTDASGAIVHEITNLDDLDALPYIRKGVAMHEIELQGLSKDEDPYVVVYMNAYGDVLRVLRNRQYEEADPSGMFNAWDSWDMGYSYP